MLEYIVHYNIYFFCDGSIILSSIVDKTKGNNFFFLICSHLLLVRFRMRYFHACMKAVWSDYVILHSIQIFLSQEQIDCEHIKHSNKVNSHQSAIILICWSTLGLYTFLYFFLFFFFYHFFFFTSFFFAQLLRIQKYNQVMEGIWHCLMHTAIARRE